MMLEKNVQIRPEMVPRGWSSEAVDFCNQLIQRKPTNRLGYNGPQEVKTHPWIRGLNWEKLMLKQEPTPFSPPVS